MNDIRLADGPDIERALRRLLERVPALLERVVGLRRQADVDLAGSQSLLKMRYVEANYRVVTRGLFSKIDPAPGRVSGRPELEPGEVIEKIAVHRAAPIEDRADAAVCDQDVVVQQVAMDEVSPRRTVRNQRLEARQRFVERTGTRG